MDEKNKSGRRRKKLSLTIAVVAVFAVIIAAGGVGLGIWHEQPGFCNTLCHQPMDAYVKSYESEGTLMVSQHREADVTCLQCHEPTIKEQLTEAGQWMKGSFRMDQNGMLTTVGVRADKTFCTGDQCHDFAEVVATTENWNGELDTNPHRSHQGVGIDCSNCHSAHEPSYLLCNACHEYDLPEGWVNPRSVK
ncbi:MAG: cytochrome c3 family protein [Coriobacteriales bacterium]|jgi:hypothetical protein|nr:cytochrome c3 family protein [Coriobacteriales bacterium]